MTFGCSLLARPSVRPLGSSVLLIVALLSFTQEAQAQGVQAPGAQEQGAQEHGEKPEPDASPEVSKKAHSIARQTMSPFCPGRTLSDCPSEYAAEWRRDIRKMVAEGKSDREIRAELESRVGGNLSGIPNDDSSYALPIGLATGAALLLFFVFVRLRGKRGDDEPPPDKGGKKPKPPPAVDDARLDDELDNEN